MHAPEQDAAARRAIAKSSLRLIPFLFLLYIIAYLDRINVSFAALQMNPDVGIGPQAFGLGAGIFFLGYFLFEIPSNLILAKVGARRWIARIMVSWGLVAMAMAGVQGEASFLVLRFVLGVAEAGFFPGIILYLTYWFPAAERGRIIALFMTATALAGVVGSPISGALLSMDGWLGLRGWHWLFILEGLPAVVLGVVVWFVLDDGPENARWLTEEERHCLASALAAQREATEKRHGSGLIDAALLSPHVWRLALLYLALVIGMYGIGMWLPQIVGRLSGADAMHTALLTALPYAAAALGMVWIGRSSDRMGERPVHLALALLAAAFGLAGAAVAADSLALGLAALCVAAIGIWGALGPFWAHSTTFLAGSAAAGGIALINSVGNLGGFAGPYLMGWLKSATSHYAAGLFVLSAILVLGTILAFSERKGEDSVS